MNTALINQLVMIFLLAAVGYAARKGGILNEKLQVGLSGVVLNIAVPGTILASANHTMQQNSLTSIWIIVVGGFLYQIVVLTLMTLLAKALHIPKGKDIIFSCLATFSNVAFIGYPIITIFLPDNGIFLTTFFIITFNLTFYTYGVARISGQVKLSFRSIFGSLPTIASFLMIFLFVLQIKMPTPVQATLEMLGSLCTPLSMIIIGSMLAGVRLRELLTTKLLYLSSFLRLLLIPTAVFGLLALLRVPNDAAIVLLVMSGLPAGSMTAIAAQQHNTESHFASEGVLHSTLFFAVTVSYLALLVSWLP